MKSSKASQERHFTRPLSQHLLLLRDDGSPTSPTRILSTSGESVGNTRIKILQESMVRAVGVNILHLSQRFVIGVSLYRYITTRYRPFRM